VTGECFWVKRSVVDVADCRLACPLIAAASPAVAVKLTENAQTTELLCHGLQALKFSSSPELQSSGPVHSGMLPIMPITAAAHVKRETRYPQCSCPRLEVFEPVSPVDQPEKTQTGAPSQCPAPVWARARRAGKPIRRGDRTCSGFTPASSRARNAHRTSARFAAAEMRARSRGSASPANTRTIAACCWASWR
jgi:hypothetical protein